MKIDTTYLRSRLARRIFWLFVACALIPILVLAAASLRGVSQELQQQSHLRLNQSTHDEGMVIYERLVLLDANLRLIGQALARSGSEGAKKELPLSPNVDERFRGVAVYRGNGTLQRLSGQAPLPFELTPEEWNFLDSGKTLLSGRPCGGSQRCIYLTRELGGGDSRRDRLVAEIAPAFLWDGEDLPELVDICILDGSGDVLYCSQKTPPSAFQRMPRSSSGVFEWSQGGQTYMAHSWKVPMKGEFLQDHWTVVASEAKHEALSSLSSFRRSFVPVILLALWVILLLSLMQIRRTLVPLEKLQEGTRKVAKGDFGARVAVESKDEFQELASSFNLMAGRIEQQVLSLKTLNQIDRAILSSWNLDQIVEALIVKLPKVLPVEMVGITILQSDSREQALTYLNSTQVRDGLEAVETEISSQEMQSLVMNAESRVIENRDAYPQYLSPLVARGMRQFLVVPILLESRPVAVLALGRSEHREWAQEERQQLRQVADQMAVALSNAALVHQLRQLKWGTLTALAQTIDAKSPWTSGHSERVTSMAIKIGREMELSDKEIDILHAGGLLHDIGKIGVPGAVLDKPGQLTAEERQQIQAHVLIGERILKPIPGFEDCLPIVLEHHEWFNGKGYPHGIAGEKISLYGRIFAVADVFDALISDRPYRCGMSLERVLEIIRESSGTQFDPRVVDVFFRLQEQEGKMPKREPVAIPV